MTKHEAHEYEERRQLGGGMVAVSTRKPSARALPLKVRRLTPDAVLPTKANADDSGFDLFAAEDVVLTPGETAVVKTGIAIELPPGYEATIRPRSGITAKTKLRVQLGTIDTSYRGELGIIVDNVAPPVYVMDYDDAGPTIAQPNNIWHTLLNGKSDTREKRSAEDSIWVRKGDKIAQLVVQKLPQFEAFEVSEFTGATKRGTNGFGSSGVRV